jgi:hypothetical protein
MAMVFIYIKVQMEATDLRSSTPADKLGKVQVIYNDALIKAFYVTTALSAFIILPALGMEWRMITPMGTSKPDAVKERAHAESTGDLTSAKHPMTEKEEV